MNFDVPAAAEDYIHRVGRTARMEAVGDAMTLVSPAEETDFRSIERAVGKPIARVTRCRLQLLHQRERAPLVSRSRMRSAVCSTMRRRGDRHLLAVRGPLYTVHTMKGLSRECRMSLRPVEDPNNPRRTCRARGERGDATRPA